MTAELVQTKYRKTDAHFHMFNFIQVDDGPQQTLARMDQAGVDSIMVNGMGVCKKWSEWDPVEPTYYLSDDSKVYTYSATDVLVHDRVTSLPAEAQSRFHPFICGFNSTDRNAVDHVRRMIELFPNFWQGIGEIFARHDDLTALMQEGEPGRANHVGLGPVYDLAAEYDLPVSVHSDITSVWHSSGSIYLHELREAVAAHPATKFIWCHAGMSRRLDPPALTTIVRDMLEEYPNLCVDLSWVLYDIQLVRDGRPNPKWVALLADYPTRFMIGSDTVGDTSNYVQTMSRYDLLLDELDAGTANQIAKENFLALLPKERP
ncbi:amidohydrolase family protein [Nocardia sp. NPDC052316]|uniref:amidohydrolase family protein n=1 Tax=Nocardia sp. NPDC052316 TaxID=3364329 RepID=UPI0037C5D449